MMLSITRRKRLLKQDTLLMMQLFACLQIKVLTYINLYAHCYWETLNIYPSLHEIKSRRESWELAVTERVNYYSTCLKNVYINYLKSYTLQSITIGQLSSESETGQFGNNVSRSFQLCLKKNRISTKILNKCFLVTSSS